MSLKHRVMSCRESESGFTLVEVMVALAIMAIISLTIPTILQTMFQAQKQASTSASIEDIRQRFRTLLLDGTAWGLTVQNNAVLSCLLPGNVCTQPSTARPAATTTTNYAAGPFTIIPKIYNNNSATPTIFFDGTPGTNGYTLGGIPCTGYTAAGNTMCPLTFKVSFYLACPGGVSSTCTNPLVYLNVIPVYSPGANDTHLNVGSVTKTLSFIRGTGDNMKNQPFSISHRTLTNAGGGLCDITTGVNRPFDPVAQPAGSKYDPYGIVTVPATGFTLGPGTYQCSATAVCFACGGFKFQIKDAAANVYGVSNAGYAGKWNQVEVSIPNFSMNVTGTTHFEMFQTCSEIPGGTPNADIYALGLPIPTSPAVYVGVQNDYARISCTLIY